MSTEQEDLDFLSSFPDRVPETPPGSPSNYPGRDAVRDGHDCDLSKPVGKSGRRYGSTKKSGDVNVEKYSGLRISNQQLAPAQLADLFSEIRFLRLPTIRNLLAGDSISGCWATVGVLTEKGQPRTSSIGKSYCIWSFSCLDETTVPVFLFGKAYQLHSEAKPGTVFALLNGAVRKDESGPGFSLSVYSPKHILKMGNSVDYGVCKGKRKDGMACTLVINKQQGVYCRYHNMKAAERFFTVRTELKGGNLGTAFRTRHKSRGAYMADPLADKKPGKKPVKQVSLEGLQKKVSNGERLTTSSHSQGLRFLNEIAENPDPASSSKVSGTDSQHDVRLEKRSKLQKVKGNPSQTAQRVDAKRRRTGRKKASVDNAKQGKERMVELQLVDSDEE